MFTDFGPASPSDEVLLNEQQRVIVAMQLGVTETWALKVRARIHTRPSHYACFTGLLLEQTGLEIE